MRNRFEHPLAIALVGSLLSITACALALSASNSAKHSSRLALVVVKEIKKSRENSILLACEEANQHHKTAAEDIAALVAKSPHPSHPLSRAEAHAQREQVALFINAIAPKYDCAARLRQLTSLKKMPVKSVPASKAIAGHSCSSADEAFQCILPSVPRELQLRASPFALHGVDFAWGAPSVAGMRALGARFGASYFSYDPSKGWIQRPGLVSGYHRAGIATVGVWETSAGRAGQGCGAGRSDAREASRQARRVGNISRPIDFAIDFDASGPQVDAYFRCIHGVLGARTSAYGGYYPLKYLCARGLVGHTNWQTYAWSGNQWLPASCAPLEQYLNGSAVDYDRAIAADYGQWPGPAKPKPRPCHASCRNHKLRALYARRSELRADLTRRRCRVIHGKHAFRLCPYWAREGRAVNRQIRSLGGR